ncbi:MAG: hypothetical protein DWQ04_17255 [Chloroflexi bacterium]|nr:MAG: hypothetical protein DWQ04_17255 [Chloroflexota bacterium]
MEKKIKNLFLFGVFMCLSILLFNDFQFLEAAAIPIVTHYELVFESHNQSIWGPGEAWSIPDTSVSIIERFDWDEDFELDGSFLAQAAVPSDPNVPQIPDALGVTLSGRTYGEFALEAVFRDFGAASADIVYPVAISTTQSSAIVPGQTVTVETNWAAQEGVQFVVNPLSGQIDIDTTYEFYLELMGEACYIFDCDDTSFGTPLHLPLTTDTIFSFDVTDPVSLDLIPGIEGSVRIPNVQHQISTLADGATLIAEGADEDFVQVSADLDTWLPYVFGICEEIDIGIEFDFCVDLLDIDTNFMMSQYQKLTLTPQLFAEIMLPQAVPYRVMNGNTVVESGVGAEITYNVDYQLELDIPVNWTYGDEIIAVFDLDTTIENQTETTFSQDLTFDVIKMTKPFELGPAYDYTLDIYTYIDDGLFDQNVAPWKMPFALRLGRKMYLPLISRPQ